MSDVGDQRQAQARSGNAFLLGIGSADEILENRLLIAGADSSAPVLHL
jgi:hypothetical protein